MQQSPFEGKKKPTHAYPYTLTAHANNSFQQIYNPSKVQTLSERLWTSAARDLFVDVPRSRFFASADSKSTSFTIRERITSISRKTLKSKQ